MKQGQFASQFPRRRAGVSAAGQQSASAPASQVVLQVLQHLGRRGVVDPKRYQDEAAYRTSMDELAAMIPLRFGAEHGKVIDLLALESQPSAPKGQAFTLSELYPASVRHPTAIFALSCHR